MAPLAGRSQVVHPKRRTVHIRTVPLTSIMPNPTGARQGLRAGRIWARAPTRAEHLILGLKRALPRADHSWRQRCLITRLNA